MENPFETTRLPTTEDLNPEESSQQKLILVAEDSPDSAVPISLHLQQTGFQVVMAKDGEEAIQVAIMSRPNLILMDLAMPVLDGLAAARKIRELAPSPRIPLVAISAFSTSGFLQAAHDVGFDGYLTKPVDFARMDELIKTLIEG
ncbi:MAG TPA: response regulator [Blastocatellia bacterium]|nr:response regulator [Blastocatellia bacterium]